MKVLFLFCLLLVLAYSQPGPAKSRYYSVEQQGIQFVDSKLSYITNIRKTLNHYWVRGDKAQPNAFTLQSDGSDPHSFWMHTSSYLKPNTYPFASFDVVSAGEGEFEHDVVIGPTYGPATTIDILPGLPLQSSSTQELVSPIYESLKNVFLYQIVIDRTASNANTAYFYAVGWRTTGTDPGLVLVKGSAQLRGDGGISINQAQDILLLDSDCYDVFTETSTPKIFLTNAGAAVTVVVPGRCNSIYNVILPTGPLNGADVKRYAPEFTSETKIDASAYAPQSEHIYFTTKAYNSAQIELYYINIAESSDLTPKRSAIQIPFIQEFVPVLAADETTSDLYVATAGFNQIYQYNFNPSDGFTYRSVAVLPDNLNQVSDMLVDGDFIYWTTWEANAKVARLNKTGFCSDWCGKLGYCSNNQCNCISGYEQDPLTKDHFECVPEHYTNNILKFVTQQGLTAALGVLFAFSLIACLAGWFVWFRKRQLK